MNDMKDGAEIERGRPSPLLILRSGWTLSCWLQQYTWGESIGWGVTPLRFDVASYLTHQDKLKDRESFKETKLSVLRRLGVRAPKAFNTECQDLRKIYGPSDDCGSLPLYYALLKTARRTQGIQKSGADCFRSLLYRVVQQLIDPDRVI